MYTILIRKCCYLYKYGTAREIVCACYGGLTVGLYSRHPASCRGNSGEAGDAKPENLDSGPKVSFNLLFTTYFFFGAHLETGGLALRTGAALHIEV